MARTMKKVPMNPHVKWQCQCTARDMVETLARQGYDARYAEDLAEARVVVLSMVPEESSVALGGSETLAAMGLVDHFSNGNYRFFDRYQSIPFEETVEIYRQSMLADFLVTGTNAITRKGELVNIDSSGNRAAGILFGPRRVIVVAGVNKVVDTLDAALARLTQIAPLNCKRVGHDTPCAQSGRCSDCSTPARMCNVISIVNNGRKFAGRISVVMIAEEAGF